MNEEIENLKSQRAATNTRIAEVEKERDSLKDELHSAGLLTGWSLSKSAREHEELTQQVATLTTQHDAALARVAELEGELTTANHYLAQKECIACGGLVDGREMARVKELEEDGKFLDWIWKFILERGSIEIRRWDHDGRLILGRTLLIHNFAERGGEDETLRAAIRTAMTETGGEADKQIAESREAVDALGGISNLRLKPKTGGGE